MKQTIHNSRLGLLRFTCSNGYEVSIGIGVQHYSDNNAMAFGQDPAPTSTMKVAIFDERNAFVVLPYDVAGYVPVARLGAILAAVEDRDWVLVCGLCNESNDDVAGKFPVNHLTSSL